MFNVTLTNPNKSLVAKNLGQRINRIAGIVLHDTAGSGTHNDTRYLVSDPEHRGISVDFTVERDGTVYQLNPNLEKNCTYHAGRNTKFTDNRGLVHTNGGVNQSTVGIEISQKADLSLVPMWPAAQMDAVAGLCVDLCKAFQLTKTDILTHSGIITDGSRSDPRKFPFTGIFWPLFNLYYAGSVAEMNLEPGGTGTPILGPIIHTVVHGDTLYGLADRYKTKIEHIKALNGINQMSNVITVGQQLIVKE